MCSVKRYSFWIYSRYDINNLFLFHDQNENTFSFPELDLNNARARLWKSLINLLSSPKPDDFTKIVLGSLRILSRDKKDINEIVCSQYIDVLLKHAGIVSQEEAIKRINQNENFEGTHINYKLSY